MILAIPAMAQSSYIIRGKVMDAQTLAPLAQVVVQIRETGQSTLTNEAGYFECGHLRPGNYLVSFSHVGYRSTEKTISIRDSSFIRFDVSLFPVSEDLTEVTVTGMSEEQMAMNKVRNNVMPVTIITAKQIENRAGNLNEILARQAGVQIRMSGGLGSEGRISVRGLEGKRVQVFIDGNPLNTPDGSLGINDLPLQIIERIEIYKGTVPAWLGGDGLGSAVNIVIKHRSVSYIDATASYQSYHTVNTGLILKKTLDKQGIEAGAGIFTNSSDNNYTMRSPYQPGLIIQRDHDRFKSLLAGASVRFHKYWFNEIELEGAYMKVDKQIQGIQKNIQQAHNKGNTGVVALGLIKNNLFNQKADLRYNAIYADINVKLVDTSSYNYDWDGTAKPSITGRGEIGNYPHLSTSRQKEARHRFNLNYRMNEMFTLNINNTLRYGHFDPDDSLGNHYAGKNLFNYPGNLFNSITGLTLETRLKNDQLLISAAIKHYYNHAQGYNTSIYLNNAPDKVNNVTNEWGYNAGIRYNFTRSFLVKASHERSLRLPTGTELFGDGVLITPAIFLQPEVAYNQTLGLIYDKMNRRGNRIQAEANVFYMQVNQLIQLAGNGLSLGYVNYAKARIMGADIELKGDIHRNWHASVNATYQQLTDRNRYIPGTQNVANPTYNMDIPNIPQLFANWSIEFHRNNLLSKDSRTRILYDGSFVNQYYYGFKISRYDNFIIPSYTVHTLSLEQSFKDRRYTITGEVNNLFDASVLNNYNQPLPGRTFRLKLRYLLLGNQLNHQH
jgi:outer membrane cobalamin receptor